MEKPKPTRFLSQGELSNISEQYDSSSLDQFSHSAGSEQLRVRKFMKSQDQTSEFMYPNCTRLSQVKQQKMEESKEEHRSSVDHGEQGEIDSSIISADDISRNGTSITGPLTSSGFEHSSSSQDPRNLKRNSVLMSRPRELIDEPSMLNRKSVPLQRIINSIQSDISKGNLQDQEPLSWSGVNKAKTKVSAAPVDPDSSFINNLTIYQDSVSSVSGPHSAIEMAHSDAHPSALSLIMDQHTYRNFLQSEQRLQNYMHTPKVNSDTGPLSFTGGMKQQTMERPRSPNFSTKQRQFFTSVHSSQMEPQEVGWERQRDLIACEHYKKELQKTKILLKSSKVFLNMVIHDFRNPTSQIHFAIDFVLQQLTAMQKRKDDFVLRIFEAANTSMNLFLDKASELEQSFVKLVSEEEPQTPPQSTQLQREQVAHLKNQITGLEKQLSLKEEENTFLRMRLAMYEADDNILVSVPNELPQVQIEDSLLKYKKPTLLVSAVNSSKTSPKIEADGEQQPDGQPKQVPPAPDLSRLSTESMVEALSKIQVEQDLREQQIQEQICEIELNKSKFLREFSKKEASEVVENNRFSLVAQQSEYGPLSLKKTDSEKRRKPHPLARLQHMSQRSLDQSSQIQRKANSLRKQSQIISLQQKQSLLMMEPENNLDFDGNQNDDCKRSEELESCSESSYPGLGNQGAGGRRGSEFQDQLSMGSSIHFGRAVSSFTFQQQNTIKNHYSKRASSIWSSKRNESFSLGKSGKSERVQKLQDALNKFKGTSQFISTKWKEAILDLRKEQEGLLKETGGCIEMIESCKHSSIMLMNLINDMLDLAKQEQLTFQLHKSYFDLRKTINNSFKTLEFLSSKKKISLKFEVNPNHKKFFKNIFGDEKRYEQILLNFLSNALKFTDEGGTVRVILEAKSVRTSLDDFSVKEAEIMRKVVEEFEEEEKRPVNRKSSHISLKHTPSLLDQLAGKRSLLFVKFSMKIVDSGQGIKDDDLGKLFMNFSRLDQHQASDQRGTGLGLSICKNIIEKMGGKVEVSSILGEGTTFDISVSTVCQVVDDHASSSYEHRRHFSEDNTIRELSSSDGSNSRASRKQWAEEKSFFSSQKREREPSSSEDGNQSNTSKVTHSDSMPVNRRHRNSMFNNLTSQPDRFKAEIQKMSPNKRKSMKAPSAASVPKPRSTEHEKMKSGRRGSQTSENSKTMTPQQLQKSYQELSALIAINDDIAPFMMQKLLSQQFGIRHIDVAMDSEEAYLKALTDQFDLIIVDVHMQDGFKVCSLLKQDSQPKDCFTDYVQRSQASYIVALTSSEPSMELFLACKESGFDDLLTAPIDMKVMEAQILQKLARMKQAKQEERARSRVRVQSMKSRAIKELIQRQVDPIQELEEEGEMTGKNDRDHYFFF